MSDCVIYGGYGVFAHKKKTYLAHRVAWELANGPIPDGLYVCHHCDNPSCVNVAHLFVGTLQDNMADRKSKGRYLGEWNGRAKLTEEEVKQIRSLANVTMTPYQLSAKYGVSNTTIYEILSRTKWRHI